MVTGIPAGKITDWASFHEVFEQALGLSCVLQTQHECMETHVDTADGLTSVSVPHGEILVLRIDDPFDFKKRCPEQYDALIECSAFVNFRRTEVGDPPVPVASPQTGAFRIESPRSIIA